MLARRFGDVGDIRSTKVGSVLQYAPPREDGQRSFGGGLYSDTRYVAASVPRLLSHPFTYRIYTNPRDIRHAASIHIAIKAPAQPRLRIRQIPAS